MKTQFSYLTLLILTVLASFVIYSLGSTDQAEMFGVVVVAAVGSVAWLTCKWYGLPITLIATTLLIANVSGHRFYGSPRIRPVTLNNPVKIESLELPNTLVLSDGSRKTLDGVTFKFALNLQPNPAIIQRWSTYEPPQKELNDPESVLVQIWRTTHPSSRRDLTANKNFTAELKASGDSVRGKTLLNFHYWCGNSFFPRMFPRDLLSASKIDLGEFFVLTGAATPNSTDSAYMARLEQAREHVGQIPFPLE